MVIAEIVTLIVYAASIVFLPEYFGQLETATHHSLNSLPRPQIFPSSSPSHTHGR